MLSVVCQRHDCSLPPLPFCGTEFAPTLCNVALPHAKTECVPCALDVGTSQPCNPLRSCCWDSFGPRATGCVRHVDFTTMRGDAFPVGSVASTNRMICVPTTHVYFVFTNTCGSWRHAGALVRPTAILHDLFVNLSQHRMLAAGMIDAFVCAFNVHRAHTEQPGRFSHWTIGRVRMMIMLCADYSHGYQTPCCGTRSRVAESFFLSRPKTRCSAVVKAPDHNFFAPLCTCRGRQVAHCL